ncbi:ABC transporter ATP-binding protein [Mesohalobacter halotolerans]|jgi:iron complex transport system ATP-binding protein|uniref:ABC transporter ATP-binding protein n=1 Tax=Mesohalobacter halotolerans TaxID=1883405 RepID=A0A4U5TR97_9FLAO|nr:ABC transporter ATP-binding protein [Mesohalobacter halotolerans]MBS3737696.1 ABC transporter ATP-binding protein [Psychroflexus sp.]NBC56901.1 ATP-binding cassette domain-containing protein [Bacteroidota bacterium]TKS56482.1 ABC transporter ATP-binding protein [Mesohalobacter halotolerans]
MRLETKQLSVGYNKPKVEVASGINISIKNAGLTAVIGVNGSGKSTLIKSLSGLINPLQGDIKLYNRPLNTYTVKEIAQKISLVLTKQRLPQHLKVIDFVALGRQPYTNWIGIHEYQDKNHIIKALKQVKMYEAKDKACSRLSDGQLQKVLIARAIAQNTPLILLDEPTSHLDMYHKAMVLNLLKSISTNHDKSVIFATHEINLALQLCDSIILIKDKQVIHDTPQNLIHSGILHELFPQDLIKFDEKAQLFKMNRI